MAAAPPAWLRDLPAVPPLEPDPFEVEPTAEPEPSPVMPPPGAARGQWMLLTGAVLITASLLVAAFTIGYVVRGDDEPAVDPLVDAAAAPVAPAAELPSAPLAEAETPAAAEDATVDPVPPAPDANVEPVAAAAAIVSPAVVLIETDFGQGSGIIYDPSGLLVTNAHVVGAATEVVVQLASGVRVPGVVIGADSSTDIAVIDIPENEEFGVAVLAPLDTVEVGQLAIAIGSPFGLEQTVTAGIVSALDRVVPGELNGVQNVVGWIQTDAPINPGNSGGALVDREGRVIGMNTSIRTDGGQGNLGVGFAIPSDTIQLVAERIVNGESLQAGYLGVSGGDPNLGQPGALISDVVPGGAADQAGIQAGDLIVGIGDQEVESMAQLGAKVRLSEPGTVLIIHLLRNGEPLTIEATLGSLVGS